MLTKTGKDTSGRSNAQLRKNIVMRFLGGCKKEEIAVFLNLIFEPFQHMVTGKLYYQGYLVEAMEANGLFTQSVNVGTLCDFQ